MKPAARLLCCVGLVFIFDSVDGNLTIFKNHLVNYLEGTYSENNVVTIDANTEYIVGFTNVNTPNPYKISAYSTASARFPAMIVARQEKQVLSWQLPMLVSVYDGILQFRNSSRTLCYSSKLMLSKMLKIETEEINVNRNFSISVSTSSITPINVTIRADEETNYFIENDRNYTVKISPSQPVFFYYEFTTSDYKLSSAFIEIDSEDDVCLTVSIQRSLCPVRDLNQDIKFEGNFQTINLKGATIVREKTHPDGFFLVFVAKGDNYECNQESSMLPMPRQRHKGIVLMNRISELTFRIRSGLDYEQYIVAVMVVLGINIGFCLLYFIAIITVYYWKRNKTMVDHDDSTEDEVQDVDYVDSYLEKDEFTVQNFIMTRSRIQKRSFNYLWHIANIGIFYGIPVVQLMVHYQRNVNLTGNLDQCYHNFLCAHPLFGISDFNHIYSNIGYVLLGILLLCVTLFRYKKDNRHPKYGIPNHYGLFYAMGIGLILEGIFSACYHICPSQSNYQFDTSFMYVMAVLCIIKLYQNRHPSINASAYATFTVLGIAVFVAMLGILSNSTAIMLIFVISYLFLCVYLSFKIYFVGYVLKGCYHLVEYYKRDRSVVNALVPIRKGRFVLLILANLGNLTMAILGIVFYPSYTDFGTYLLFIVMGNSILHTIFYLSMKLIHKERICWEASIYGLLALISWGSSAYFFLNASTLWTVTPAESRQMNRNCIVMDFYDHHDIWHLLSAPALFFTFMMLMNLDDDLADVPQSEIKVF